MMLPANTVTCWKEAITASSRSRSFSPKRIREVVPRSIRMDVKRHAFCTRLSWVAPDAVIERAMRHTSPETKRIYQLSMVEQVREAMEKANQKCMAGASRFTDAVYMTLV